MVFTNWLNPSSAKNSDCSGTINDFATTRAIIVKRFNEKGKYLNYSGTGYSISFDFKIDNNFNIIKFFFNSLVNKYNLKVNFSKDLIVKKSNAFNYPEFKLFKKAISLLNKKKKINSLFSKRLEI